jgi:hypothetical protein
MCTCCLYDSCMIVNVITTTFSVGSLEAHTVEERGTVCVVVIFIYLSIFNIYIRHWWKTAISKASNDYSFLLSRDGLQAFSIYV